MAVKRMRKKPDSYRVINGQREERISSERAGRPKKAERKGRPNARRAERPEKAERKDESNVRVNRIGPNVGANRIDRKNKQGNVFNDRRHICRY